MSICVSLAVLPGAALIVSAPLRQRLHMGVRKWRQCLRSPTMRVKSELYCMQYRGIPAYCGVGRGPTLGLSGSSVQARSAQR